MYEVPGKTSLPYEARASMKPYACFRRGGSNGAVVHYSVVYTN